MGTRSDGTGLEAIVDQGEESQAGGGSAPGAVAAQRATAHRRPSGEAPPLPRPVSRSSRACVVLGGTVLVLWSALLVDPPARLITSLDLAIVDTFEQLRVSSVTAIVERLQALGSIWVVRVIVWGTLLALLVFRRFQHLITYLVVILVASAVNSTVAVEIGRMRPAGVDIIGHWEGYAHPSAPVAALGLALVGALHTLVPAGRWRLRAGWSVFGVLGIVAVTRLYLGVDHPTDIAAALVTGVALPVVAFRLAVPDEVFPLDYGGGRRAHLDVTGRRGEAIRSAVESQLGITVDRVEPFALAGSAGSTPLRLQARRGADQGQLFAKLYALTHLRSDRSYKLVRTVLYGRLEDERPFNTVRRLVGYEDHMLRLLRDAGIPTATPYGIVEITPEREYLVVTEFLEGAVEITAAELDGPACDAVVDDGLRAVRRLWDAGLAHRDIKPSNVLVRDGRVHLIDVAFGEARPTPWRQAVDLANMMLTLALCSDADRVYQRALVYFSPDEVAEAFAASRGVTIPTGLRTALHTDGRRLLDRFRELAPDRPRVSIQRWGVRRLALTVSLVVALAAAAFLIALNLRLAGLL
jgi:tRNA A-37 threonylcarbamoyl transferase component Bud32